MGYVRLGDRSRRGERICPQVRWPWLAALPLALASSVGAVGEEEAIPRVPSKWEGRVPGLGAGAPSDRIWVEYYYREPSPAEGPEVLRRIAAETPGGVAGEGLAPLRHFFATVVRSSPDAEAAFAAAGPGRGSPEAEALALVLAEARGYAPAEPKTAAGVDLLWAEYLATGDGVRLGALVGLLGLPAGSPNEAVVGRAMDLISERMLWHGEIYDRLTSEARGADGERLARMQGFISSFHDGVFMPSHIQATSALNLWNEGKYREARLEALKALDIYPDSSSGYINLATALQAEGKDRSANVAARRAAQASPGDRKIQYGAGRIAFLTGEYELSAKAFLEAIRLGDQRHNVFHALARAYQEMGDRDNAVTYFRKYLALAPHGEYEGLVRAYLRSVGAEAEPDADDLVELLRRGAYDELESRLGAILKARERDENGESRLAQAYALVGRNPDKRYGIEEFLLPLQAWAKARPNSHFARAMLGSVLVQWAWAGRGTGFAGAVTEEGWRRFAERLPRAREELEKAYGLDPTDPIPPADLITVARGLGLDREEMEKYFRWGVAADPGEYAVYLGKYMYLMPQWGGSDEEMLAFGRETLKGAPGDSLAPVVLAKAHWEIYHNREHDRRYFQDPAVWAEISGVYDLLCRRFPDSVERHNWFAITAYLAGDFATARRELDIVGDRWLRSAWGTQEFFDQASAEVRAAPKPNGHGKLIEP